MRTTLRLVFPSRSTPILSAPYLQLYFPSATTPSPPDVPLMQCLSPPEPTLTVTLQHNRRQLYARCAVTFNLGKRTAATAAMCARPPLSCRARVSETVETAAGRVLATAYRGARAPSVLCWDACERRAQYRVRRGSSRSPVVANSLNPHFPILSTFVSPLADHLPPAVHARGTHSGCCHRD